MGRRLIDADKLIELIDDDIASLDKNMPREGYDVCLCTLKMAKQYIKALPTIEAAPLKHGKWIRKESRRCYWFECSECGYPPPLDTFKREWFSNYCPNCGAKMDERRENGSTD